MKNKIKSLGLKKIIIGLISFALLITVVYASVAADRKSSKLPWQGTPSGYYDSAHNVGISYLPENRFTVSGDVVEDSITGLMWQKSAGTTERDICKTYDKEPYVTDGGDSDDGTDEDDCSWEAAKAYCANLNLGGYDDWRLPNIKELNSIVDYSKYNPSIDTSKFTNTASTYYWSSTTSSTTTSYAWILYFNNGFSPYTSKTTTYYVRCVR